MKQIHPGVREVMTEAESTSSLRKPELTNYCNFYAGRAGLHFFSFLSIGHIDLVKHWVFGGFFWFFKTL